MSPGALPFISVEAFITPFHFALPLVLQSTLQCVLAWLGSVVNPTFSLAVVPLPRNWTGTFHLGVISWLHQWRRQLCAAPGLQQPAYPWSHVITCVHVGTECHCLNIKDSLRGCKGPQNMMRCIVMPVVLCVLCNSNPKSVGVLLV